MFARLRESASTGQLTQGGTGSSAGNSVESLTGESAGCGAGTGAFAGGTRTFASVQRGHVPFTRQCPSGSPPVLSMSPPTGQCESSCVGSAHSTRCHDSAGDAREDSSASGVLTCARQCKRSPVRAWKRLMPSATDREQEWRTSCDPPERVRARPWRQLRQRSKQFELGRPRDGMLRAREGGPLPSPCDLLPGTVAPPARRPPLPPRDAKRRRWRRFPVVRRFHRGCGPAVRGSGGGCAGWSVLAGVRQTVDEVWMSSSLLLLGALIGHRRFGCGLGAIPISF